MVTGADVVEVMSHQEMHTVLVGHQDILAITGETFLQITHHTVAAGMAVIGPHHLVIPLIAVQDEAILDLGQRLGLHTQGNPFLSPKGCFWKKGWHAANVDPCTLWIGLFHAITFCPVHSFRGCQMVNIDYQCFEGTHDEAIAWKSFSLSCRRNLHATEDCFGSGWMRPFLTDPYKDKALHKGNGVSNILFSWWQFCGEFNSLLVLRDLGALKISK